MKFFTIAAAGAIAALMPAASFAATLIYSIDGDGHHASFSLPSNPTSFIMIDAGFDFGVEATGTFDGVANLAGITFYANPYPDSTPNPGGLTYLDNTSFYSFDWSGPQLYSGPESAPTLLAFGPTVFTDLSSGSRITISAIVAGAVPEPASWATMVIGFAMIGGATRARRKTSLVFKRI